MGKGKGRGSENAGKNGGLGDRPHFLPGSRFLSPSPFTPAMQRK